MNIYSIETFSNAPWNKETKETTLPFFKGSYDEIEEELKNDKHYNIKIDDTQDVILFGDIDHVPADKPEIIEELFNVLLKKFNKLKMSDISYSLSKTNYEDVPELSYHWSIPKVQTTITDNKFLMEQIKKDFGQFAYCIDTGIYKNGWFRLPGQTNKERPYIHNIINGKMRHFLIYKINNCRYEYKPIKEPIHEQKDNKINEPNDTEKMKKTGKDISHMVSKMINYFDDFDKWTKLGMIIHNEYKGNEDGLILFDKLSQTFKNYKGKFDVSKMYMSIKPTGKRNKLTISSLYKMYYELFPTDKQINDDNCDSIFKDPIYLEGKKELEKRVFKLNYPVSFVILEDNNDLQIIDLRKLTVWAKGKYKKIIITKTVNGEEKEEEKDLINIWIDDPDALQKNKLVFEPKMIEDNNYNMFKGFDYTTGEAVKENESKFLSLLKFLCDDVEIYEYMLCWISHIINKPWMKTNIAVVLFSKMHGIGKNALIDGLCKLFGSYSGHIESIEDITRNFNCHIVNKLFIYGDEINANAKKVSDKLKQVITRTTMNLEKKGVDAIEIANYSNWMFSTNNENCFKIEEDDRRLLMIKCPNEALPKQVFKEYYKEIENKDELNKLYNFFKNYKNDKYEIGVDRVIMTKYKKQLSYENIPPYIEMFYKLSKEIVGNSYSSTELYTKAKDYAKTVFSSSNFTVTTFGKCLKEIFWEYVKKSHGIIKYNFKSLDICQMNEHLYNYNKGYYKYVNNIDENEEPIFEYNKEHDNDNKNESNSYGGQDEY